ncbi:response regulator [Plastoroseomonas hellenica]|uniref:response regulator n=1 Tax=Plastoroseomonas hellenica TaxID=2687306 RepID=UPI001BA6D721|nr:response regulator [Plastoroseomonas hellenica]
MDKKAAVLVVEDEWPIAEMIAHILRRLGYEVLGEAPSVRVAMDMIDGGPDLALLDIQLGRETSYPVADELARRGIPFAFVTSYSRQDLPERFARCLLLSKPFGERALQGLLNELQQARLTGSAGA